MDTIHQCIIQAFIGIHHFMTRSIGILMDYGLTPRIITALLVLALLDFIHITITFIMADMVMVGYGGHGYGGHGFTQNT